MILSFKSSSPVSNRCYQRISIDIFQRINLVWNLQREYLQYVLATSSVKKKKDEV